MIRPVITVWLLPPSMTEEMLRELQQKIVKAATGLPSLQVKSENDLFVFFPADMMQYGLGKEVLVEVTNIYVTDFRVCNLFARELVNAVHDSLPDALRVRCNIRTFDRDRDVSWPPGP